MDNPRLSPEAFEAQIGLHFHDRHLLEQALTHRSYVHEHQDTQPELQNNERLEFLGDAVIEFVAGAYLFQQLPHLREGKLTLIRAELVRTEMLAEFALICRIDRALRLGHGEEISGGRTRNSVLCGAFEALIGALFLDQGEAAAREFLMYFFEPALEQILLRVSTKDAKSRLQEWSQAQEHAITPTYQVIGALGPDHDKWFVVEVRLEETAVGWGSGSSKRRAEQAAARIAIKELGIDGADGSAPPAATPPPDQGG
jgi:ribonuclease-3